MFQIFILFGLIITFVASSARGEGADAKDLLCGKDPVAKELLEFITRHGTKPVYDRYGCSGWDKILEGIQTGDKEWLDVAKYLWLDSDAGATIQLRDSLGKALRKNPEYILKTFSIGSSRNDVLGLRYICGCYSLTATIEECKELESKSIKAVMSVKDESLATKKAFCLAVLQHKPLPEDLEK